MESIPLSALQHYAFCPRQCALIHNEQQWAGNFLTAQGDLLHERVDAGEPETRKGVRFERSVHVFSLALGVGGILDLLEVDTQTGALRPVEYKRGRPKKDNWDKVQLCAQALCLEEMRNTTIAEGHYGTDKPGIASLFSSMQHYVQKPKLLLTKYVTCWNRELHHLRAMANIANPAR